MRVLRWAWTPWTVKYYYLVHEVDGREKTRIIIIVIIVIIVITVTVMYGQDRCQEGWLGHVLARLLAR